MEHKLLIVDDNKGDSTLIREMLADSGLVFDIQTAETGESGLEKAKVFKPMIAVIDTCLPGIDGFQTCKKLKELLQGSVKVIMITGIVDAVDAVKAREMGADEYCVKTTDYAGLIKRIKSFIG